MRALLLALVVAGCTQDVCAEYEGRACIALEVTSQSPLLIDQLQLDSEGLHLSGTVTPRVPRATPVSLPVLVPIIPDDPTEPLFTGLQVTGLTGGSGVGRDSLSLTLHRGEHIHVIAHLVAEAPDSFADLAGADLFGVDLQGTDLPQTDLGTGDLAIVTPTLEAAQNGLFGGAVTSIDHDGNGTLYAGVAGGGVFVSGNNGASWFPINNGITDLNITDVAAHRGGANLVYAASFDLLPPKLFRTLDGGANWSVLDLPASVTAWIDALAVDPGTGKPMFSFAGDVYSADDGVHFSIINPTSKLPSTGSTADVPFQLLFTQPGHVLAVASSGVHRSADAGVTWTAVNGGLPGTRFLNPAGVDPSTGAVYISSSVNIFKSTNDGQSWGQLTTTGLPSLGSWGMASGGGFLYAFDIVSNGEQGVQRSSNDGSNFSDFSSGLTQRSLRRLHILGGTVFAATSSSGIFSSSDGSSWSPASTGLTGVQVTSLAQSPSLTTLYAGSIGMGVFKSTNGGQSWTPHFTGLPHELIGALGVDPFVPSRVYAGSNQFQGIFRSDDSGVTWSAASVGLGSTSEVHAFLFDPRNANAVWAATSTGIFFSANRGDSWTSRSTGLVHGGCCVDLEMQSLVMDPDDSMKLWASSMGSGVWQTVDAGAHWTQTSLVSGTGGLAIDPQRTPRRIYAATNGFLQRSDDGGASFMSLPSAILSAGFDLPQVAVDPSNPSRVFVADGTGVQFSGDAGATFTRIDSSSFRLRAKALLVDSTGRAWVGARSGGGLFRTQ